MKNKECEVKKDDFCWCCPDRHKCKEVKKINNRKENQKMTLAVVKTTQTQEQNTEFQELSSEIYDLRNEIMWISGHITVATALLYEKFDRSVNENKKFVIDETTFLNCLNLIEDKAKELDDGIGDRLDDFNQKLYEVFNR